MIRYIKGILMKKEKDRIVVLTNGIGYEVYLPAIVRKTYYSKREGETVELFVSYQQGLKQPKPMLIGFNLEVEREFFEMFIQVKAIGPSVAIKALSIPVSKIARAIEERDVETIKRLDGIGSRKAEMIISELKGKVGKFALLKGDDIVSQVEPQELRQQVEEVLVKQLGHTKSEASRMVSEALKRNPNVSTPEELFEEVYRGHKA